MKVATWASLALVALACMQATLLGDAQGDDEYRCGRDFNGKLCRYHLCCSNQGYCGNTDPYCLPENCQSQCVRPPPPPATPLPPIPPDSPVEEIVSKEMYKDFFPNAGVDPCKEGALVPYEALLAAATFFPKFAAEGNLTTRKRELAAFFAQTGHETTGGWNTAPGGPYAWGYCFLDEKTDTPYCNVYDKRYPCVEGKSYHGRGPIQLSWNYNYGPAGEALGSDLLKDPERVANDPLTAFQTAIWFWMTPQGAKPSCHDVIIGKWKPTQIDIDQGRLPGFGVTTNIINGGIECNSGDYINEQAANRVGFFKHFCDKFGLPYGDHLNCNHQKPFNSGGITAAMKEFKGKLSHYAE